MIAFVLLHVIQIIRVSDTLPDTFASSDITHCGPLYRYQGKDLFEYMDGGAELYLAYGFVRLDVRSYSQGKTKATVEIYQMDGPEDAFGIYATTSRGEVVDIGIPANLTTGMLSFHKGNLYVRVVSAIAGGDDKNLLLALGMQLQKIIPGEVKRPAELELLPKGFMDGSERYLPNLQATRTVWFEGEGEKLLTPGARAFIVSYPAKEGDLRATLAIYPSPREARTACESLARLLGLSPAARQDPCTAAGETSTGVFTALSQQGSRLNWILGADDLPSANDWLTRFR